jgi:hypothetical protein
LSGRLRHVPLALVLVLLAALLVARVSLAHSLNVHWDEFYFLSKIHSYARGDLTGKLLTFHVHLLGWVRALADDEVSQVLRIREVMLLVGALASVATFFIGRSLLQSTVAALFAVFAGQSLSLVLNHGSSARFDPIVVASLLVASALVVRGGRRAAVVAGVATAIGFLVSVKCALYAPTLAGLFVCRFLWGADRRAAVRDAVLFALAALIAFVPLFAWHASTLASPTPSPLVAAAPTVVDAAPIVAPPSGLGAIFAKVFVDLGVQNERALVMTLRWDWGFWTLLATGVLLAVLLLWRESDRTARLRMAQLLCFALPLSSLFFYRNSFPYFYVCIVPPAALLVGLVVAQIERRLAHRAGVAIVVMIIVATPLVRAATNWTRYNGDDQLAVQRAIIAGVHETFPDAVPYVDRCAMISSFPKVGPFMSTWTLSEYRNLKQPIMRALLRSEKPQFVLQNISSLQLSGDYAQGRDFHRLLRDDFDALQKSFIPHWGPLWVAGQTIALPESSSGDVAIELLVPGRYVVEAAAPVVIDGATVSPGDVVDLAYGAHRIARAAAQATTPTSVTLRTAAARSPPKTPPPSGAIFRGFSFRKAPSRTKAPAPSADELE